MKYKIVTLMISVLTIFYIGCSGSGKSLTVADAEEQVLSSDTSVIPSLGSIDGTIISDIPFGTTLDSFIEGLNVAETARVALLESDGITEATDLQDGYQLVVTAEDGTTVTYTISVNPDPRLVASWSDFDPESGDYEIVGATVVEGITEGSSALKFDGDPSVLNYVLAPDSDALTLRDKGTIEVLINAESIVPYAGIVSKGQSKTYSDEAYGIQLYNYEGSAARLLFFLYSDDGNWIGVHGTFDIIPGTWYHIIATWNETEMNLYVNGEIDAAGQNTTGGVRDTSGGLTIGSQLAEKYNSTYGSYAWDGIIDGVIILNDYIEEAEVLARYNAAVNQ
ncbi:MAG: hypothetical protein CVV44_05200 [Spirochaetae bacterium HGW-Spirochaetae-1]|jgi:hypothetical protein|nr:MAG: hypothetical protein CVV44_05200 [Spirochaetae bacterium HGW-Spirochaetae-1]